MIQTLGGCQESVAESGLISLTSNGPSGLAGESVVKINILYY